MMCRLFAVQLLLLLILFFIISALCINSIDEYFKKDRSFFLRYTNFLLYYRCSLLMVSTPFDKEIAQRGCGSGDFAFSLSLRLFLSHRLLFTLALSQCACVCMCIVIVVPRDVVVAICVLLFAAQILRSSNAITYLA